MDSSMSTCNIKAMLLYNEIVETKLREDKVYKKKNGEESK